LRRFRAALCHHSKRAKKRKLYKGWWFGYCMAIQTYDGAAAYIRATLMDGYLPSKSSLIQKTEEIATRNEVMSKGETGLFLKRPYSWDKWDEDALFEYIAYNTRKQCCRDRAKNHSGYIWSEAWLLKPQRWAGGYELKNAEKDHSQRRLFMTLYQGCEYGDKCMRKAAGNGGLEIIADNEYKNLNAFKCEAEDLLDDVSLPFRAPCIVAENKIAERGYDFRAFGN